MFSRARGAAALLENGQVLVVDGYNTVNNVFTYPASAEPYNPSSGDWNLTASTREATSFATIPVLLTNGDVLIAHEPQFYNPGTASLISTGPLPGIAGPPTTNTLPLGSSVEVWLRRASFMLPVFDHVLLEKAYRKHIGLAAPPQPL